METILAVVVTLALVVVLGVFLYRFQETRRLRARFGPEYERLLEGNGKRRVDAELRQRKDRHNGVRTVALDEAASRRFLMRWEAMQARFMDAPGLAVREADRLIADIMRARGYPVEGEADPDLLSVDHPEAASHYREAHGILLADERRQAGTERLRQAMVHYRLLLDDLLGLEGRIDA